MGLLKEPFAWLEQQGYALVEAVETGSNLTGRKSRVRLTRWVRVTDYHSASAVKHKITQGAAYLDQPEPDEAAWIRSLYPGLEDMEEDQVRATYHITEVDQLSLARFILWLADRADGFSKAQRDRMMHQAMLIYRVAQFSRGLFLQRPKPSHFGRTYYAGVSVQNIHRTLRQAMLGDCWEYDITSAVIAWKLGQARRIQGSIAAYPITHLYLQDKDAVIRTIRADTIDPNDTDNEDTMRRRIKTALTALSFGARMTDHGWSDESGDWQVRALATIFCNQLDRARFFASPTTKAFVQEQRQLDKHLFAHQEALGFGQPNDFLFLPAERNRAYALAVLGWMFRNLLESLNLRDGPHGHPRTLYSLRHTAITLRLLYGTGIDMLTLARNARTSVEMLPSKVLIQTNRRPQRDNGLNRKRSKIGDDFCGKANFVSFIRQMSKLPSITTGRLSTHQLDG